MTHCPNCAAMRRALLLQRSPGSLSYAEVEAETELALFPDAGQRVLRLLEAYREYRTAMKAPQRVGAAREWVKRVEQADARIAELEKEGNDATRG